MLDKNTSGLAGEYLVAGELARRGYPVSVTMGNAKAVDIHADCENNKTIRIDVKASRLKTDWPIRANAKGVDFIIKFTAEYPSACWGDESGPVRNLEWGGSLSRNAPQLAVG